VQYFFNPDYGQKAFWVKQTDNEVLLDGEVHDWRFFPPGSLQLDDRGRTAQTVVDVIVREDDLNLSSYGLAIVVLGLNDHVASDGGRPVSALGIAGCVHSLCELEIGSISSSTRLGTA
jgi:hypothetical protein